MSRRINRWLRSKAVVRTLVGALAIVLIVAVAGALLGWWDAISSFLRGSALPPGGYTCLPTCNETDGKFLVMAGDDMDTFAGAKIVAWIAVPQDLSSFEIGIFDGDSNKDDAGSVGGRWQRFGNWDETNDENVYTLYADPLKDGIGGTVLGVWHGNQDPMPNNAWYNITMSNSPEARAPSGDYFYRLEIVRAVSGWGANTFKLRSTAYLTAGKADLMDASMGLTGMIAGVNDVPIVFPSFGGDYNNPGASNYDGDWQFYIYVPENVTTLDFWDGDFDRGTSGTVAFDTDDPNTTGKPAWAGADAVDERAGIVGSPADDYWWPLFRVEPPVTYEIIDPEGVPVITNDEPSGTEEWERFVVSTDASANPDVLVGQLKPGYYNVHIRGLDMHNFVWIRSNYEIVTIPPPPPCSATCPRTIGYWKNNVNKVLIRDKSAQETEETLHSALYLVAQYSELLRSGINVNDPAPIANPVPLTDAEANAILQKENGNSMLDRALQQNLATWLNIMSGKICNDTYVTLDAYGGYFEGTVWDALQEAQSIMFNAAGPDDPALERAKDMADLINNGLLGEEAEDSTCDDYTPVIPPDRQKPKPENLPKAPKADEPPNPVPQPITCDAPRVNTYGVENPTASPFYGIKFEYQSGIEVRDGNHDEFRVVLPADVAASMTSVQVEAKAGQDQAVATVTLENCAFNSPIPCGEPVRDGNKFFAFYFMGAEDNGDGTLTLAFHVQNMTSHGLSHVTIGLPDGIVPAVPTGSYQSEVCP